MPMSQSEMGGGSKTPIARKVNELQASNETTGSVGTATPATTAASRAESPFEVKFSPMVAKRMSLDAFGTSSLVGVDGQVVQDSSTVDAVADEDGVEELEEEYEDIALDEDSGAEEDLVRARSRSRSRSLSQTPHRRPVAQEYEDPDADYDMDLDDDVDAEGSEASFDGTTTQAQSGAHPYANHGYSQSFALAAAANTNTLDGWVGTQLTTIKEFPSTATLDYIPDTSIWEGDGVLNSRRQSLVRSAGTVQGLSEEGKESATVQKLVRSPRLSDGLAEAASESRQQAGPEDISKGNASLSLKRSPAMPFGLADRSASASTATDDFDRSDAGIAVEGNSMYRTPLISRAADGGGEIGKTPWTTKSGMTAFFTPLSYPVPGHQAADRSMAGEDGTDSPCAGRENSKVLGPAQAGSAAGIEAITPQDGEEPHNSGSKSTSSRSASSSSYQSARSLSSSFSSASRRLRIRSSSLPPIADEGIDITVQHNEQLSALEVQLAAVVKDRRDKEEQYETLRRRMSDVERQRRAAEEGRQEAERKVGVKERQVSESASCQSSSSGTFPMCLLPWVRRVEADICSGPADASSPIRQRIRLRESATCSRRPC